MTALEHKRLTPAVIGKSVLIAVVLLGPAAIVAVVVGTSEVIPYVLSVSVGVTTTAFVNDRRTPWLGLALVASFGLAAAFNDDAVPLALVVAGAALVSVATDRISAGLMSLLPAAAAVIGILPIPFDAPLVALVAAGGFIYSALVTRLAHMHAPCAPVSKSVAVIHASILAVTTAFGTFATVQWNLPHGYWFVLTIAILLRPRPDEALQFMWDRLIGTVIGAFASVALLTFLPTHLATFAVIVCLILFLSYLQIGNQVRQTVFLTAAILLISAASVHASELEGPAQRVGWTAAAIVLAAVIYGVANTIQARKVATL